MSRPQSVYQAFRASVQRYGKRPMLHVPEHTAATYGKEPESFSYRQIDAMTNAAIARYQQTGLSFGDRVALILENRPEFFVQFLALNALGISAVPIHHELSRAEVAYRLAHSEARLVVALAEHVESAVAACQAAALDVPITTLAGEVAGRATPSTTGAENSQSRADEAAILYTSGSTGKPKGCLLSNEYFLLMGEWYLSAGGLCALSTNGERLLTPLPLSHVNAMVCSFMAMMLSGGCLIQLDRFHPSSWWQTARESRATILHYLGVMPAILLRMEPVAGEEELAAQIKFGFGAGVDPRHHKMFEERFGFPLIEAWSMTETGAGACIGATHEPRHVGTRCFGRAGAAIDYRIVDENGADTDPGEAGELLVRAAGSTPHRGFFSGYFKDEEATQLAWRHGWFHTGDVVRVDSQGSFFFVDRIKNIVRRSGENIAAIEVENVLSSAPEVRLCAVSPVADELRGEEVMACVVLADGVPRSRQTADALFAQVAEHLAYFKTPGYIAFVDELPLTTSEKVQRSALKQLCAQLCGRGAAFDMRDRKRSLRYRL